MKNISNLDIKRHRLGLTKELSAFAIIGVYKASSIKTKLELIGLIEVLKLTETSYREGLALIFKLEKVVDASGLITKLSKQHLEAKVLSDRERLAMAPKTTPRAIPKAVVKKPVSPSPKKTTYFQRHKTTILFMSGFMGILMLLLTFSPSNSTQSRNNYNKGSIIELTPKYGHKYVYTRINEMSTTFLLDTGASTTVVSKTFLNKHVNSGFIKRRLHFLRNENYTTANGAIVNAEVWKLPSMTIGPKTIYNVEIAVMSGVEEDGFLLGMSTINKLGDPTIDLTNNKIIIN